MPSTPVRPSTARKTARRPRKPQPPLAAKKQPAQQRATETFERILEVTAQTLEDVGIERLSTNLVCQRAGLTPPALYRYFPNKYALLNELGQRLMRRQNELIPLWITPEALTGSQDDLERAIQGLLHDTLRVTQDTVAGVWITRALRAVPALQRVRLESHGMVSQAQADLLSATFPQADPQTLALIGRIAVEMVYAAVELLFDDPQLEPDSVAQIVSAMVASYLGRIQQMPASGRKTSRGTAR